MEFITNFFGGLISKATDGASENFSKNLQDLFAFEIRAKQGLLKEGEVRPKNGLSAWWERNYENSWLQWIVEGISGFFMNTAPEFVADFLVNGKHTNAAMVTLLGAEAGKTNTLGANVPSDMQSDILKAAATATEEAYAGWNRIGHMFSSSTNEAKLHALGAASKAHTAVYQTTLLKMLEQELGSPISAEKRDEMIALASKNPQISNYAHSVATHITGLHYVESEGVRELKPVSEASPQGIYGTIVNNYKLPKGGTIASITYSGDITGFAAAQAQAKNLATGARESLITQEAMAALGITNASDKAAFEKLVRSGAGSTKNAEHFTAAELQTLKGLSLSHAKTAAALMTELQTAGLISTLKDIDFTTDGIVLEKTSGTTTTIKYQGGESPINL